MDNHTRGNIIKDQGKCWMQDKIDSVYLNNKAKHTLILCFMDKHVF